MTVSGSDGLLLSNIQWRCDSGCDVNNQKHISTFITFPLWPPHEMEIVTTKAGAIGPNVGVGHLQG